MTRRGLIHLVAMSAAAMCMAPGGDHDVLDDSTFRLWCGDTLCAWQLDAGHVRQAATWHPDDYGVELVDAPTRISQLSTSGSGCMEFSAVADVTDTALSEIEVDFDLDGVPDFTSPLVATNWSATKTLIQAPAGLGQTLRFTIAKRGVGRAVLAEIRLQNVETCTGSPPALVSRPVGVGCSADDQCTSGMCCEGSCSGCCVAGAPSGGSTCPSGQLCGPASDLGFGPFVCDRAQAHGAAGAACIDDSDCVSHVCEGAASIPNPSCPAADAGGSCSPALARGGTCR